ncbi:MAG: glycosyltransferase family 4 protein [Candidatus Hydrogenedentes bacterium]|nr:glycosyltransferase family 4 protein [Candidatus Hydrogenedentota bacterium]
MRIAVDITPVTARRTGVGEYVYQLLRHGMGRGGDITWKGWSSGRFRPLPLGLARRIHLPVPTRLLHGLWRWTGHPAPEGLLGGADVVHGTNYVLPPLRKARGILSIYDLAFLVNPAWSSPRIRRHFARDIVADARRAHAVVTCSTYSRGEITRWCGVPEERVHVIHGAADPMFTPAETAEARQAFATRYGIPGPYVLYVGTLESRKNVFTLVEAFARIPRSLRATLVLAGGVGWGMESLEDALRQSGVADRVIRTGYLPDRETVRDACRGAACFAMPSWCEGFGLPLLEAMACGCACVASNTSALPEVGGDGVRYVDPGDVEGLSAVMREWLEDEVSRETWGHRALKASRRFSWEASASALLELYERVAACAC